MKLDYELKITFDDGCFGYVETDYLHLGVKDDTSGKVEYSQVKLRIEIHSPTYGQLDYGITSLKLKEWLTDMLSNGIVIKQKDMELFSSVDGVVKVFTFEFDDFYRDLGSMLLKIIQQKISICECTVNNILFMTK